MLALAQNLTHGVSSLPSDLIGRARALLCDPSGEDNMVLTEYILDACDVPLQRLAPMLPE